MSLEPTGVRTGKLDGTPTESTSPLCNLGQFSDTMHCAGCLTEYDVNDPHPPACRTTGRQCPPSHNRAWTEENCARLLAACA